jgi:methylenetetrahydrofolate--tRNA-(uracil-5-)-methyltransferase
MGSALAPPGGLAVIGGGLAGCEAAWQAARRGVPVTLFEMRPGRMTPAHRTGQLAELVCSNSLGSDLPDRAAGLLKAELRRLGSVTLAAADATALPSGGALAVDRGRFAAAVAAALDSVEGLRIVRQEVVAVPDGPVVVASGPLTSASLAQDLARLTGREHLRFYDAVSPIVAADSIDLSVAFRQSRYGRGTREEGDYLNCPMSEAEFGAFVTALTSAERASPRDFESRDPAFFEACLPIEVLAARGPAALLFGPMRPVGLCDPRTGRRPYAVVQLRQDDAAGLLYNLVGFQTNLRWPEQERVLRTIPGLGRARFERLGQMHRNTYVEAPALLEPTMQVRLRPDLWLAGQITGIEGYVGNAASGLVAGVNAARALSGLAPLPLPATTMIGALAGYVARAGGQDFQPMKANMGLLPPLETPLGGRRERAAALAARAHGDLDDFVVRTGWGHESGRAAQGG